MINYHFINKNHYKYFHLYSNGTIILYNLNQIHLPIRLEIYARDQGYPRSLNSQESIFIYICDIVEQHKCLINDLSKKLERNFYLGSIFIMISIVWFLSMIILCIIRNLFIRDKFKKRKQKTKKSFHYQIEARKNLSMKI